jgi:uncharacterized membrane protein YgcG
MVTFKRWLKHVFMPPWSWRHAFPQTTLDAIETAIRDSETMHSGEIRFAVENSLKGFWVWRGKTSRERAVEVFSHLRVWDTEHNGGVLVYLLLADRVIEIVADRGIAARVDASEWERVARSMEAAFRQGEFERGAVEGIRQIGALLAMHFPPGSNNPDELSNRPVIVRS